MWARRLWILVSLLCLLCAGRPLAFLGGAAGACGGDACACGHTDEGAGCCEASDPLLVRTIPQLPGTCCAVEETAAEPSASAEAPSGCCGTRADAEALVESPLSCCSARAPEGDAPGAQGPPDDGRPPGDTPSPTGPRFERKCLCGGDLPGPSAREGDGVRGVLPARLRPSDAREGEFEWPERTALAPRSRHTAPEAPPPRYGLGRRSA